MTRLSEQLHVTGCHQSPRKKSLLINIVFLLHNTSLTAVVVVAVAVVVGNCG